ncbi:hypothetical protein [Parageobacillus sp. G301]
MISTEGSTYQKTGAKCFISEDRKLTRLLDDEDARYVLKLFLNNLFC